MNENRLDRLTTFGELLRHLRRQAQMTQQQLGIAVGYSATMITRLENNERQPELTAVKTVFVEALSLLPESEPAKRLIALAEKGRIAVNTANTPIPSPQPVLTTNLPMQLTPAIGREGNIAKVADLMQSSRLVTLTGAGGIGKTRLALEVANRLLDHFSAGVWLVELAPATDGSLVPRIAAAVFGVQEHFGESAIQALTGYLAGKAVLIVLDNCEHMITACAGFAELLLRACPHLRILATSREALRVPGEVIWRVPSLVTPEFAARLSAKQALGSASVQLFVQRATAALPAFTLTDENASAAAQICQRLDGIPLAIEMAAARLTGMAVDEIAARLDQRFNLLTSGRRTALQRHQTLRAALDWSYQLLNESERILLQRLSVFADGCLADAAEAICADALISSADVLPLLLALVDKSLVVAEQRETGTRYRMLETVRAFAAEKLTEREGAESVHLCERHAAFMISLSDQWWRERLTGAEKTTFILRLEIELGNVRALLGWARNRSDDSALSLELAAALWSLWISGGFLSEGQAWLEQALAHGKAAPDHARAQALGSLANVLFIREEYAGLESISRDCLELAERVSDVALMSSALKYLGIAAQSRLDFAQAIAYLTRSLGKARDAGLHSFIPDRLILLGQVYLQCGETTRAVECLEEGVARSIHIDVLPSVARGRLFQSLVDLPETLEHCRDDVAQFRVINHRRGMAMCLFALGHLMIADGQYNQADDALVESHNLWRSLGLLRPGSNGGAPLALFELARLAWLQGQNVLASRRYQEYREVTMLAGDNDGLAHACLWMGYLALGEQDLAAAEGYFKQCLTLWQVAWHRTVVLAALARLAEVKGECLRAAHLYGAASAREQLVRASLTATDRLVFDRDMDAAHKRFADTEWGAAWDAGSHMTLDQAVAFASDQGINSPRQ